MHYRDACCVLVWILKTVRFQATYAHEVLPPMLGASVYAIACILSYDGLSGISLSLESVDSLTSMVNATEIDNSVSGKRRTGQNPNSFLKALMTHGTRHKSPSRYHKNKGVENGNSSSSHNARPLPFLTSNQRPSAQGPSSAGCGSSMHGPHGPRGDSFKRQRGNGSGK